MAIHSSFGDNNTGKDIVITLTGDNGVAVPLYNVMEFEYRQEVTEITRVRLDNSVLAVDLPKFWQGSISFDRGSAAADQAISAIEQQWITGGDFTLGTLTATISGAGEDTITFNDVTVRLDEGGRWKGDDVVPAKITFRAATRNA